MRQGARQEAEAQRGFGRGGRRLLGLMTSLWGAWWADWKLSRGSIGEGTWAKHLEPGCRPWGLEAAAVLTTKRGGLLVQLPGRVLCNQLSRWVSQQGAGCCPRDPRIRMYS